MRYQNICFILSTTATLCACSAAPGERVTASLAPRETLDSRQEPIQLSKYPGAPHQDRDGNLWFSSAFDGVTRYDGKDFVTFTTKDGLADDGLRGIIEDDDGTLWFATRSGLSKYDGKSFTTLTEYEGSDFKFDGFGKEGDHRELWGVLRDSKGTLWIATMDGVFRHDGKAFHRFPLPVTAPAGAFEFTPKMVYDVFEDRAGNLWFGTDGAGAIRFDGENMTVYTEKTHGLCSDRICEVLEDCDGNMWFGSSGGGVSRFDGEKFETFLRSEEFSKHTGWGRYMGLHLDRDGHVWFGRSMTGGGVDRFNGKTFEYFGDEAGLAGGGIPSLREDRNGDMWFGTTAGVYRFDGERFENFTRNAPFHVEKPAAINLEEWPSEIIELPPGFAQGLPSGVESLRFAPGWRDPNADGFWSYVFAMWIDEAIPDAKRLTDIMESYYEGLMTAVAGAEAEQFGGDMAQVEVMRVAPREFEMQMKLIDAFGDLEPIELRGVISTKVDSEASSILRISVSPQSEGHSVWRELEAALAGIRKP